MNRLLRRYLAPALVFVAVLAVWEFFVRAFGIQGFLLPPPSEVVRTVSAEWPVVWPAGLFTLREALGGLFGGSIAAIAVAFAVSRWSTIRVGVQPLAVAAGSAPIIALAPITNQWFGITNPVSKMAVVAVVVYFPVMINTTRGLLEVPPAEIELMRSMAATPNEVTRLVRIPSALPFFFASLKVACALSIIAAIVAEYFGGPQDVLGQYIINRANLFQFPDAWAAILVASILGVAFYLLVLVIERLVMPWHVSFRATE